MIQPMEPDCKNGYKSKENHEDDYDYVLKKNEKTMPHASDQLVTKHPRVCNVPMLHEHICLYAWVQVCTNGCFHHNDGENILLYTRKPCFYRLNIHCSLYLSEQLARENNYTDTNKFCIQDFHIYV